MQSKVEDIIEAEAQRRYPVNELTKDLYVASKITFKHGARFGFSESKVRMENLEGLLTRVLNLNVLAKEHISDELLTEIKQSIDYNGE